MSNNNEILIICVSYHSDDALKKYLRSVDSCIKPEGWNIRVLVVDNGRAKINATLYGLFNSLKLKIDMICPGKNLGYLGGANLGFGKYCNSKYLPSWIIVSNVDVEINDSEFFLKLVSNHENYNVGAIAPAIYSTRTGKNHNPFLLMPPSRSKVLTLIIVYRNKYLFKLYALVGKAINSYRTNTGKNKCSTKIFAGHGSFIILSRNYFISGGSLAFNNFLYGEEIFLGESIRRLQLQYLYNPELVVYSTDSVSTSNLTINSKLEHLQNSLQALKNINYI